MDLIDSQFGLLTLTSATQNSFSKHEINNISICTEDIIIDNVNENYATNFYFNEKSNLLVIDDTKLLNKSMVIYDIKGKVILQRQIDGSVNLSYLQDGVYFLKIENQKTLKFIKL